MKSKDKKFKKKIYKRRRSYEDMINISEEEHKVEPEPIMEINEITHSLDARMNNNMELSGGKGHNNYYSKQLISTGTYYFEVYIKSMEYNMQEYINEKRTDEFSKKYYDPILQNLKTYSPNIRIGFINSSGDLDLCLGADTYSYGYRASDGGIINEGECSFNNTTFGKGDTIGVLIHLKPPMPGFLKNNTNGVEKNNECFIKYFVNGMEQPEVFRGIWEGNYAAAVTLYNFANVIVNYGPNFKYYGFDPTRNVRGISDLG